MYFRGQMPARELAPLCAEAAVEFRVFSACVELLTAHG